MISVPWCTFRGPADHAAFSRRSMTAVRSMAIENQEIRQSFAEFGDSFAVAVDFGVELHDERGAALGEALYANAKAARLAVVVDPLLTAVVIDEPAETIVAAMAIGDYLG